MVSDIHGNVVALDAVLAEAEELGVDHWWALGDLVLFGPRPVEVVERLQGLPSVAFVSGNTDRYVVTGAAASAHDRVRSGCGCQLGRALRADGGRDRLDAGALCQGRQDDSLAASPSEQRTTLPDGSALLGVHASPTADDGPGIDTDASDDALSALLAGGQADVIVGGHTHDGPTGPSEVFGR